MKKGEPIPVKDVPKGGWFQRQGPDERIHHRPNDESDIIKGRRAVPVVAIPPADRISYIPADEVVVPILEKVIRIS